MSCLIIFQRIKVFHQLCRKCDPCMGLLWAGLHTCASWSKYIGGPFCEGLCKWQRIGRIRAVRPACCGWACTDVVSICGWWPQPSIMTSLLLSCRISCSRGGEKQLIAGLVNAKYVSLLLGMGPQRRWVRGPLATTAECRHTLGDSHLQSGWSLMLATRETDQVKVKNGHEQLGKGSEMKKILNLKLRYMCKRLYSNLRDQMPEHAMKSAGCRALPQERCFITSFSFPARLWYDVPALLSSGTDLNGCKNFYLLCIKTE